MQVLLALVGPMDRLHDGVVGSAGVSFLFIIIREHVCAVLWDGGRLGAQ